MKDTVAQPKPDYADIFGNILWDMDKAKYLLTDINAFFECPDPEYPSRINLETIKYEYKHIVVMLGLLDDLVRKVYDTAAPHA